MDIAEDVDGHMLAVPRKHVKNILDCDPDTLNHLMAAVKRVAGHCAEKCEYEFKEFQAEFDVAANDQGRVYLIIGTDSGFEGTISWYLDDISVGWV